MFIIFQSRFINDTIGFFWLDTLYTHLYCKMIDRFRDKILSGKEQNAGRTVARRGFATQTGEILAERYEHFSIEESICSLNGALS